MHLFDARLAMEQTIAKGIEHPDYKRNCHIAKMSRMYVTGEGQAEEFLMELRDKETARQKLIRVKVTKPITPYALNPVKTEYEEIFRVDGISKVAEHENPEKNALLSLAISTYHSNQSLTEYFKKRYLHYNFTDPNAWHITERRNIYDMEGRLKGIDVYPFEVSSEQAVNYHFDNGVPQWLIVRHGRTESIWIDGKEETKEVNDFYFYAAGVSAKYTGYSMLPVPEGYELFSFEDTAGETVNFTVEWFDTGSTEFPGDKWGSYSDQETNLDVKVPPFWTGARFVLDDLIGTKSSFDVSKYNHVFPKLFHYDYRCNYMGEIAGVQQTCISGYLNGNKEQQCPQCKGTGGMIHVSESDVITFDMPTDPNEMSKLPPLSNLAYYHNPPLDVTQAIWDWINAFVERVYLASFNTSYFEQGEAQKTAFESSKIWNAKKTRIYPCAVHFSRMWEKSARVASQYLEIESEGLTVRHFYPYDMKLEPLEYYVSLFKSQKEAGVSYEAIWDTHCTILAKSFLDEPEKVADIKAWEHWRPFRSLSHEQAQMVIVQRAMDDPDRVLWENWDKVKRIVTDDLNDVAFSELSKVQQEKKIGEAVTIVSQSVKTTAPKPEPFPSIDFNDNIQ